MNTIRDLGFAQPKIVATRGLFTVNNTSLQPMKTGTHFIMQFQDNSGNWIDDAVCETLPEAQSYFNKLQCVNKRIILRFLRETVIESSSTVIS